MNSNLTGNTFKNDDKTERNNCSFKCIICFDVPSDPVLTQCGHLYCWNCLMEWLENRKTCPLCNASCNINEIVPIHVKGKVHKHLIDKQSSPSQPTMQGVMTPLLQAYTQQPHTIQNFNALSDSQSNQFGVGPSLNPPTLPYNRLPSHTNVFDRFSSFPVFDEIGRHHGESHFPSNL
eukprot:MONOS_12702.1-p1 / transcript=MONOS_12702.1 / gene=MONOS_12702 / organism=Monocercomonoides_exilis_PA203 / gene_product=unspecified product / transcript_product=unspecified product / location=Mono_scaffold00721:7722-8565(+) / protein_length=176 / sequence_SO=supercontig / SO=protein_coding / is_pseudo=false